MDNEKWKMQHVERVHILGIPVDSVTLSQAIDQVTAMLAGSAQHHIMTPNSEMLLESKRNAAFREVLLRSSLNLPDSAGVLWAAQRQGQHLPERVSGVDFVEKLCAVLHEGVPVFFLGGRNGAAKQAAEKLRMKNEELIIAGEFEGSPHDAEADDIIRRVNASGAKLLLVAYGAPQQDLWIAQHLSSMPYIRVAMGVGGTFDFLSGRIQRAPQCMQRMGLEWLWRLCKEPRRWKRIFRATVVFPYYVLKQCSNN